MTSTTSTHRRRLTAAIGAFALVGTLIGCGSSGSSATKATTTTSTSTTTAPTTTTTPKAGKAGKAGKAKAIKALMKDKAGLDATAAQAIGIPAADLETELHGGKSIAQVATERQVDISKVTDALGADVTKRIDDAVTQGTLTSEEADQAKQRLPMTLDKFVNRQAGQGHGAAATGTTGTAGTATPDTASS